MPTGPRLTATSSHYPATLWHETHHPPSLSEMSGGIAKTDPSRQMAATKVSKLRTEDHRIPKEISGAERASIPLAYITPLALIHPLLTAPYISPAVAYTLLSARTAAPHGARRNRHDPTRWQVAQQHNANLPPYDSANVHRGARSAHGPTRGLRAYPTRPQGIKPPIPDSGPLLSLLWVTMGGLA